MTKPKKTAPPTRNDQRRPRPAPAPRPARPNGGTVGPGR